MEFIMQWLEVIRIMVIILQALVQLLEKLLDREKN